nr:hypothetical protein [Tanacetum cinerariifolium]
TGNSFTYDTIPESYDEVPDPPPKCHFNIYLCQICINPLIDHHCYYECGNSLNDFFCPHCTCEFCGNGAHSCVEKLVSNPSESEGENGCDVPACFTTFLNILFDAEYESDYSDYQSCSDEYFLEEIFSNPLFEEEIIPMKIDQHHFNAESDLIESMLNHYSSIIPSSSKIDSLLDEFAGELTLLKSIQPGIDETDCYPEEDIRLIERLLNLNIKMMGDISEQKVPIPKLTITLVSNQKKSPDLLSHRGLEIFQPSAKCPMMIHGKNIPILDVPLFHLPP